MWGNPEFARRYDMYDRADYRTDQLEMYCRFVQKYGTPVLELGSGTGIISLALATHGFEVVGLELSKEMIRIACKKLQEQSEEVRQQVSFIEGNMIDFDIEQRFRTVLLPSNTFGYLIEIPQQQSCLKAIYRHLDSEGILILEERHYTPQTLNRLIDGCGKLQSQSVWQAEESGVTTSAYSLTITVDVVSQIIRSRTIFEDLYSDGHLKRYVFPSPVTTAARRYYHRFELEHLLRVCGFEVLHLYGNSRLEKLSSQSFSMIFVAAKQATSANS